jgi:hypothetical protein
MNLKRRIIGQYIVYLFSWRYKFDVKENLVSIVFLLGYKEYNLIHYVSTLANGIDCKICCIMGYFIYQKGQMMTWYKVLMWLCCNSIFGYFYGNKCRHVQDSRITKVESLPALRLQPVLTKGFNETK